MEGEGSLCDFEKFDLIVRFLSQASVLKSEQTVSGHFLEWEEKVGVSELQKTKMSTDINYE